MKLVLSLVILCLAGVSAKSVQDLQSELLQAIREMIEDPPQGEDVPPYSEEEEDTPEDNIADTPVEIIVDPMPPNTEEEAPPDEDNTVDPMPPNTEEEEAPPSEDNTIGPMTPNTEEEEEDDEAPPGEVNTIGPVPPSSEEEEEETPSEDMGQEPLPAYPDGEESDAAEGMGPSLTDGEEEEEGDPPDKKTVQDLESELLHAIRQMIEDPETLQAGREVKSNKVQDVTMKVTYKGEESEEKVSFDDVTGSETILVSARSDMEEANIRHCFNEGLSLECFPGNSKCYLLSIASEGEPDLQQQKEDMAKFLEESPSGRVSADDVPEVTINWVEKEKVSREDLPACLADFQSDFAVFSAVKAPADEGTVTDDRGDGLAQEGKRYVSGGSQQCASGACPIRKQVQKQGSCYYACYRWVCNYFSTECVCCPEVTRASQCLICRD
ncbi:uncharacterized protein LOC144879903 [Branchiostoma floridae x Branchiostoma japonicum]